MIRRSCAVLFAFSLLGSPAAALFGREKRQKEREDAEMLSYAKLAKGAMAEASSAAFDAKSALAEIQNNPAVQAKMRAMMQDPAALAELTKLMQDPTFKAQVEAFAGNPDVQQQLKADGVNALLRPAAAAAKRDPAATDAEYADYASQFTGEQSATAGLRTFMEAARDPAALADALNDLNDPEMLAQSREMMRDPGFQREMERMMAQPEMKKLVDASRAFVEDAQKDPKKMREIQQRMAALTGGQTLEGSEL